MSQDESQIKFNYVPGNQPVAKDMNVVHRAVRDTLIDRKYNQKTTQQLENIVPVVCVKSHEENSVLRCVQSQLVDDAINENQLILDEHVGGNIYAILEFPYDDTQDIVHAVNCHILQDGQKYLCRYNNTDFSTTGLNTYDIVGENDYLTPVQDGTIGRFTRISPKNTIIEDADEPTSILRGWFIYNGGGVSTSGGGGATEIILNCSIEGCNIQEPIVGNFFLTNDIRSMISQSITTDSSLFNPLFLDLNGNFIPNIPIQIPNTSTMMNDGGTLSNHLINNKHNLQRFMSTQYMGTVKIPGTTYNPIMATYRGGELYTSTFQNFDGSSVDIQDYCIRGEVISYIRRDNDGEPLLDPITGLPIRVPLYLLKREPATFNDLIGRTIGDTASSPLYYRYVNGQFVNGGTPFAYNEYSCTDPYALYYDNTQTFTEPAITGIAIPTLPTVNHPYHMLPMCLGDSRYSPEHYYNTTIYSMMDWIDALTNYAPFPLSTIDVKHPPDYIEEDIDPPEPPLIPPERQININAVIFNWFEELFYDYDGQSGGRNMTYFDYKIDLESKLQQSVESALQDEEIQNRNVNMVNTMLDGIQSESNNDNLSKPNIDLRGIVSYLIEDCIADVKSGMRDRIILATDASSFASSVVMEIVSKYDLAWLADKSSEIYKQQLYNIAGIIETHNSQNPTDVYREDGGNFEGLITILCTAVKKYLGAAIVQSSGYDEFFKDLTDSIFVKPINIDHPIYDEKRFNDVLMDKYRDLFDDYYFYAYILLGGWDKQVGDALNPDNYLNVNPDGTENEYNNSDINPTESTDVNTDSDMDLPGGYRSILRDRILAIFFRDICSQGIINNIATNYNLTTEGGLKDPNLLNATREYDSELDPYPYILYNGLIKSLNLIKNIDDQLTESFDPILGLPQTTWISEANQSLMQPLMDLWNQLIQPQSTTPVGEQIGFFYDSGQIEPIVTNTLLTVIGTWVAGARQGIYNQIITTILPTTFNEDYIEEWCNQLKADNLIRSNYNSIDGIFYLLMLHYYQKNIIQGLRNAMIEDMSYKPQTIDMNSSDYSPIIAPITPNQWLLTEWSNLAQHDYHLCISTNMDYNEIVPAGTTVSACKKHVDVRVPAYDAFGKPKYRKVLSTTPIDPEDSEEPEQSNTGDLTPEFVEDKDYPLYEILRIEYYDVTLPTTVTTPIDGAVVPVLYANRIINKDTLINDIGQTTYIDLRLLKNNPQFTNPDLEGLDDDRYCNELIENMQSDTNPNGIVPTLHDDKLLVSRDLDRTFNLNQLGCDEFFTVHGRLINNNGLWAQFQMENTYRIVNDLKMLHQRGVLYQRDNAGRFIPSLFRADTIPYGTGIGTVRVTAKTYTQFDECAPEFAINQYQFERMTLDNKYTYLAVHPYARWNYAVELLTDF